MGLLKTFKHLRLCLNRIFHFFPELRGVFTWYLLSRISKILLLSGFIAGLKNTFSSSCFYLPSCILISLVGKIVKNGFFHLSKAAIFSIIFQVFQHQHCQEQTEKVQGFQRNYSKALGYRKYTEGHIHINTCLTLGQRPTHLSIIEVIKYLPLKQFFFVFFTLS